MKIHITKNTFHWKLDLESLSTAPVWCSVLSIGPLKHNGKWVIVHYMAFVFRYEILASESEWDYQVEATVEEGGAGVGGEDGGWESRSLAASRRVLAFLATDLGKVTPPVA